MSLEELRNEIDSIDMEIVSLLNKRTRVSLEIFKEKQQQNLPIYDPLRENRVLKKVSEINNGPLSAHQIETIYKVIIEISRTIQQLKKG